MENDRILTKTLVRDIETAGQKRPDFKPLITIIAPMYNEEAIVEKSLREICSYMERLTDRYRWEILVVNDGSRDRTGSLAEAIAGESDNIFVYHHPYNRNLGGALKTGFRWAQGDIIIVLDIDLSYAPEHIGRMLGEMEQTDADVVVASPYMRGGRTTKVPPNRLIMSRVVNFFMRMISGSNIHTFTGMVRTYKGDFIRSLNLKSTDYSINPEIIYKSLILHKKVVEIPAHLDWSFQVKVGNSRTSSIKILKGILAGMMSGFIFRPYVFFFGIGAFFFLIACYVIMWIFIHTYQIYPSIEVSSGLINDRFSEAVAAVFRARPHAFFVGGTTLMVALIILGIGFLSLQNKRYFDELFHINSTQIINSMRRNGSDC